MGCSVLQKISPVNRQPFPRDSRATTSVHQFIPASALPGALAPDLIVPGSGIARLLYRLALFIGTAEKRAKRSDEQTTSLYMMYIR